MSCSACAELAEGVSELRLWARSRIEWCRKEEMKFGVSMVAIESATERRALQAVLGMLERKPEDAP